MKLLSKIIEFAKQRTICKTAHYPFDCQTLAKALSLLFSRWSKCGRITISFRLRTHFKALIYCMLCYRCGRVVDFFDIACARTCDRVRACVCEIIWLFAISFLLRHILQLRHNRVGE